MRYSIALHTLPFYTILIALTVCHVTVFIIYVNKKIFKRRIKLNEINLLNPKRNLPILVRFSHISLVISLSKKFLTKLNESNFVF